MKKQIAILSFAFAASLFLLSCKSGKEKEPPQSEAESSIPYTVELVEYVNPALPNLHSFTHATYEDKIIMLGGRRRGLHENSYQFTNYSSNDTIYIVDTNGWDTIKNWKVSSQSYTNTVKADPSSGLTNIEQFHANNAEFFTQNNTLYMIGGLASINPTYNLTFSNMTAIDLKELVNAVQGHSFMPLGSVRQTTNSVFTITGGELGVLNNTVYLAFGWNTSSSNAGYYTHKVSSFTFTDNIVRRSLSVTINSVCATCADPYSSPADTLSNSGNFRRRDGSMSAAIDPKTESAALMYYAGVFKNGNTNFTTPIWIRNNSAEEVSNFHMRGNVYTCQVIPLYSNKRKEFYATLLGGMTNSTYSFAATSTVFNSPNVTPSVTTLLTNQNSTITTVDPNNYLSVPFFNGITTIKIDNKHNMSQYMMSTSFPTTGINMALPTNTSVNYPASYTLAAGSDPYNGAESEIIWKYNQDYNYKGSGVIDFDAMFSKSQSPITIGYHFGGILSLVDNVNMNNTTKNQERLTAASNRIFAIKIVPTASNNSTSKK
jgi:hypothetical protein